MPTDPLSVLRRLQTNNEQQEPQEETQQQQYSQEFQGILDRFQEQPQPRQQSTEVPSMTMDEMDAVPTTEAYRLPRQKEPERTPSRPVLGMGAMMQPAQAQQATDQRQDEVEQRQFERRQEPREERQPRERNPFYTPTTPAAAVSNYVVGRLEEGVEKLDQDRNAAAIAELQKTADSEGVTVATKWLNTAGSDNPEEVFFTQGGSEELKTRMRRELNLSQRAADIAFAEWESEVKRPALIETAFNTLPGEAVSEQAAEQAGIEYIRNGEREVASAVQALRSMHEGGEVDPEKEKEYKDIIAKAGMDPEGWINYETGKINDAPESEEEAEYITIVNELQDQYRPLDITTLRAINAENFAIKQYLEQRLSQVQQSHGAARMTQALSAEEAATTGRGQIQTSSQAKELDKELQGLQSELVKANAAFEASSRILLLNKIPYEVERTAGQKGRLAVHGLVSSLAGEYIADQALGTDPIAANMAILDLVEQGGWEIDPGLLKNLEPTSMEEFAMGVGHLGGVMTQFALMHAIGAGAGVPAAIQGIGKMQSLGRYAKVAQKLANLAYQDAQFQAIGGSPGTGAAFTLSMQAFNSLPLTNKIRLLGDVVFNKAASKGIPGARGILYGTEFITLGTQANVAMTTSSQLVDFMEATVESLLTDKEWNYELEQRFGSNLTEYQKRLHSELALNWMFGVKAMIPLVAKPQTAKQNQKVAQEYEKAAQYFESIGLKDRASEVRNTFSAERIRTEGEKGLNQRLNDLRRVSRTYDEAANKASDPQTQAQYKIVAEVYNRLSQTELSNVSKARRMMLAYEGQAEALRKMGLNQEADFITKTVDEMRNAVTYARFGQQANVIHKTLSGDKGPFGRKRSRYVVVDETGKETVYWNKDGFLSMFGNAEMAQKVRDGKINVIFNNDPVGYEQFMSAVFGGPTQTQGQRLLVSPQQASSSGHPDAGVSIGVAQRASARVNARGISAEVARKVVNQKTNQIEIIEIEGKGSFFVVNGNASAPQGTENMVYVVPVDNPNAQPAPLTVDDMVTGQPEIIPVEQFVSQYTEVVTDATQGEQTPTEVINPEIMELLYPGSRVVVGGRKGTILNADAPHQGVEVLFDGQQQSEAIPVEQYQAIEKNTDPEARRVNPEKENAIKDAQGFVSEITHQDGKIYKTAYTGDNGETLEVYVLSGDPRQQGASLVVINISSREVEPMAQSTISGEVEEYSPEAILNDIITGIEQQFPDEAVSMRDDAMVDLQFDLRPGTRINLDGVTGTVIAPKPDGEVIWVPDGKTSTEVIGREDTAYIEFVSDPTAEGIEATEAQLKQNLPQEQETQQDIQPAPEQAGADLTENVTAQDGVQADPGLQQQPIEQAQQQPIEQPQAEIPRLKDGSPDYDAMPPDMLATELQKEFGDESADVIRDQIKTHQKQISNINRRQPKSINEKAKNRREIASLQAVIERLNQTLGHFESAVSEAVTQPQAVEQTEQAAPVAQQQEVTSVAQTDQVTDQPTEQEGVQEGSDPIAVLESNKEEILAEWENYFGSREKAELEFSGFIGDIKSLQEKGGYVYRVVYLNDASELNKDNLGVHWTVSEGDAVTLAEANYSSYAKQGQKTFIVKLKTEPNNINTQDTDPKGNPYEKEIGLVDISKTGDLSVFELRGKDLVEVTPQEGSQEGDQVTEQPGVEAVTQPVSEKSNWRQNFDQAEDIFRKAKILRAIADISKSDQELSDILDRVAGLPEEGNIVWTVYRNPNASDAVKQRAKQMYDEIWTPKTEQPGVEAVTQPQAQQAPVAAPKGEMTPAQIARQQLIDSAINELDFSPEDAAMHVDHLRDVTGTQDNTDVGDPVSHLNALLEASNIIYARRGEPSVSLEGMAKRTIDDTIAMLEKRAEGETGQDLEVLQERIRLLDNNREFINEILDNLQSTEETQGIQQQAEVTTEAPPTSVQAVADTPAGEQAPVESVSQQVAVKITGKQGDNIKIEYKGKEYVIGYSADGYNTPYGIVMPGKEVFSFINKDSKAAKIWDEIGAEVTKQLQQQEPPKTEAPAEKPKQPEPKKPAPRKRKPATAKSLKAKAIDQTVEKIEQEFGQKIAFVFDNMLTKEQQKEFDEKVKDGVSPGLMWEILVNDNLNDEKMLASIRKKLKKEDIELVQGKNRYNPNDYQIVINYGDGFKAGFSITDYDNINYIRKEAKKKPSRSTISRTSPAVGKAINEVGPFIDKQKQEIFDEIDRRIGFAQENIKTLQAIKPQTPAIKTAIKTFQTEIDQQRKQRSLVEMMNLEAERLERDAKRYFNEKYPELKISELDNYGVISAYGLLVKYGLEGKTHKDINQILRIVRVIDGLGGRKEAIQYHKDTIKQANQRLDVLTAKTPSRRNKSDWGAIKAIESRRDESEKIIQDLNSSLAKQIENSKQAKDELETRPPRDSEAIEREAQDVERAGENAATVEQAEEVAARAEQLADEIDRKVFEQQETQGDPIEEEGAAALERAGVEGKRLNEQVKSLQRKAKAFRKKNEKHFADDNELKKGTPAEIQAEYDRLNTEFQETVKALGNLSKTTVQAITDLSKKNKDLSKQQSERLSQEFDARQKELEKNIPEDERMEETIMSKLQFQQPLTNTEIGWANENMFLPPGYEMGKDGFQEVKPAQPRFAGEIIGKGEVFDNTLQDYLEAQKKKLGAAYSELVKVEITDQFYSDIEDHIKAGGTISQATFDSLEKRHQDHFNKYYNNRGDKIENPTKTDKPVSEYRYKLLLRPFGIGTQPDNGFVRWEDDGHGFGVLVYNRRLDLKEVNNFNLEPTSEIKTWDGKQIIYYEDYIADVEVKQNERGKQFVTVKMKDADGELVDTETMTPSRFIELVESGEYKEVQAQQADQPAQKQPWEMTKEEYESFDTRGYAYAIVKDGQVLTTGSNPIMAKEAEPISELLKYAQKHGNGELYIAPISQQPLEDMSTDGLIMGMTWEQLNARQQGRSIPNSMRLKLPEGAVLFPTYEQFIKQNTPEKQPWEMTRSEFIPENDVLHAPTNKKDAPTPNRFKPGDLSIDIGDDPYVYEFRYVNPNDIDYTEKHQSEEVVLQREDTKQYIEWYKQGIEPHPISVIYNTTQKKWITTNRRRLLAARAAGVDQIPAFVEIGKHKDLIRQALSEGKPVPEEVLNDYPELKKQPQKLEKGDRVRFNMGGREVTLPWDNFIQRDNGNLEVDYFGQKILKPGDYTIVKPDDGPVFAESPDQATEGNLTPENVEKNLVALHNVTASNLVDINKRGAMVTPSLAVVPVHIPFTDFGDITLVADRSMIDPKTTDTRSYAGDVYSPTVPRQLWNVNKNAVEKRAVALVNRFYKTNEPLSDIIRSFFDGSEFMRDLGRYSPEAMKRNYNDRLKVVYLADKQNGIRVPMQPRAEYLWGSMPIELTTEQRKQAKKLVDEYRKTENPTREASEAMYDFLSGYVKDYYTDRYKKLPGELRDSLMADLEKAISRYIGSTEKRTVYDIGVYKLEQYLKGNKEVNTDKLQAAVNRRVKDNDPEYQQWLNEFIDDYYGPSYFMDGNKKVPYTLDNLVDATSGNIRGAQTLMTYGMNQAKASGIREFSSVDQMHQDKKNVVTKEKMTEIEDALKEKYFDLANKLAYRYPDTWDKLNSLGKALADFYKIKSAERALRKNDFRPTEEGVEAFKEYAKELRESPVDYFEAKTQRAVKLNEFKGALVPRGTKKEVLDVLRQNGLRVRYYPEGNKEERNKVLQEFTRSLNRKEEGIMFAESPIFVTNSQVALERIRQEKATPEQWKAMLLKNGAKEAELEWMGWDEHFGLGNIDPNTTIAGEGVKVVITKADIQQWIDQNQVEVKEVELSQPSEAEIEALLNDEVGEGMTRDEAMEFLEKDADRPKYSQYQLPGGDNYKELLLTMPDTKIDGLNAEMFELQRTPYSDEVKKRLDEISAEINKIKQEGKLRLDFRSSHFDEPNIIAHVRFNERIYKPPTDPAKEQEYQQAKKQWEDYRKHLQDKYGIDEWGDKMTDSERAKGLELMQIHKKTGVRQAEAPKKILFIEEIQSDWAQKGKKAGFATKPYYKKEGDIYKVYDAEGTFFLSARTEDAARNIIAENPILEEQGVPDMPFKKTDQWVQLALRRMMRYAAENGFDGIAWTPGEVQADRYDLSKQVEHINARPKPDNTWDIGISFKDNINSETYKNQTPEQIENLLGKELGAKIINNQGELIKPFVERMPKSYYYGGNDLKIGGSGMKAFYDNIVPKITGKLIKPFGVKVEMGSVNIGAVSSAWGNIPKTQKAQMVLFNDQMRQAFSTSQLMFALQDTKEPAQAKNIKERVEIVKKVAEEALKSLNDPREVIVADTVDNAVEVYMDNGGTPEGVNKIENYIANGGRPAGFYDTPTDKAFLVAERYDTKEGVLQVVTHEHAHATMKTRLGGKLASLTWDVWDTVGEEGVFQVISRAYDKFHETTKGEEYVTHRISDMVRNGIKPGDDVYNQVELQDPEIANDPNFVEKFINTIYHATIKTGKQVDLAPSTKPGRAANVLRVRDTAGGQANQGGDGQGRSAPDASPVQGTQRFAGNILGETPALMGKTSPKITVSNKALSQIFEEFVLKQEDALTNVLFNWDDVDLVVDRSGEDIYGVTLKGNAGRDAYMSRGLDYAPFKASKREFIQWLFSDKPFSKEYSVDQEWTDNINALRDIARKHIKNLPAEGDVNFMAKAWHGSPHRFNKFSTQHIGTGEGAQAYGWGLYFTDLESIARSYAQQLGDKEIQELTIKGIPLYRNNVPYNYDSKRDGQHKAGIIEGLLINEWAIKEGFDKSQEQGLSAIQQIFDDQIKQWEAEREYDPDYADQRLAALKKYRPDSLKDVKYKVENNRNLYSVKIHGDKDVNDLNWLEWDQPVTQEQYNGLYGQGIWSFQLDQITNIAYKNGNTGAALYKELTSWFDSDKEASLFLLRAGIDGIRYPAESVARGTTRENTRGFNYVVFDENAIEIDQHIMFSEAPVQTINIGGTERPIHNSNGQIIHPTREGIKAFWEWFGDSKVVDQQGRPMVVYHGTGNDFDTFKGKTVYFAMSENDAAGYAVERSSYDYATTNRVIAAYIRIENPAPTKKMEQLAKKYVRDWETSSEAEWAHNDDRVRDGLVKIGYDGLGPAWDFGWDGDFDEIQVYAVFSPSQIKSATGNRGTFDANDGNIMFAERPEPSSSWADRISLLKAEMKGRTGKGKQAERRKIVEDFIRSNKDDLVKLNPKRIPALLNKVNRAARTDTSLSLAIANLEKAINDSLNELAKKKARAFIKALPKIKTSHRVGGVVKARNLLQEGLEWKETVQRIVQMDAEEVSVFIHDNEKKLEAAYDSLQEMDNPTPEQIREVLEPYHQMINLLERYGNLEEKSLKDVEWAIYQFNNDFQELRAKFKEWVNAERARRAELSKDLFADIGGGKARVWSEILDSMPPQDKRHKGEGGLKDYQSFIGTVHSLSHAIWGGFRGGLKAKKYFSSRLYNLVMNLDRGESMRTQMSRQMKERLEDWIKEFFKTEAAFKKEAKEEMAITLLTGKRDENGDFVFNEDGKLVMVERNVSINKQTALDMWLQWQSESGRRYMDRIRVQGFDHKMTDQTFEQLNKGLSDRMKSFGNVLMNSYFGAIEYYDAINDVFYRRTGRKLPQLPDYIPTAALQRGNTSLADIDTLRVFASFTKERRYGAYDIDNNGLYEKAIKYAETVARFVHLTEPAFDLAYTLNSNRVKVALTATGNATKGRRIVDLIKKGYNEIDKSEMPVLNRMRRHFTSTKLFANWGLIVKQWTSFITSLDNDFGDPVGIIGEYARLYLKGELITGPEAKIARDILKNHPDLKYRNIVAVEGLTRGRKQKVHPRMFGKQPNQVALGVLLTAIWNPTQVGDKHAIWFGGLPVASWNYKNALKQAIDGGMKGGKAREHAANVAFDKISEFISTQQSQKITHISAAQQGGYRQFAMFLNSQMAYARRVTMHARNLNRNFVAEYKNLLKEGVGGKEAYARAFMRSAKANAAEFWSFAIYAIVLPVLWETVVSFGNNWRRMWDEDEDERKKARWKMLFDGTLGWTKGFYGIGFLIEYASNVALENFYGKRDDNMLQALDDTFDLIDNTISLIRLINNRNDDKNKEFRDAYNKELMHKALDVAIPIGGITIGAPMVFLDRLIEVSTEEEFDSFAKVAARMYGMRKADMRYMLSEDPMQQIDPVVRDNRTLQQYIDAMIIEKARQAKHIQPGREAKKYLAYERYNMNNYTVRYDVNTLLSTTDNDKKAQHLASRYSPGVDVTDYMRTYIEPYQEDFDSQEIRIAGETVEVNPTPLISRNLADKTFELVADQIAKSNLPRQQKQEQLRKLANNGEMSDAQFDRIINRINKLR